MIRKDLPPITDILLEVTHGRYKIKYTGCNNQEYFGKLSWKSDYVKVPLVEFYEDEILLFTKIISRPREFHFIIGGDGITQKNTYYLWFGRNEKGDYCGKISNFKDNYIKNVQLGPDYYVGVISVSEHYFVTLTEETCTCSRFFGLIDKRKFFIQENQKCSIEINLPKAYNDARIGLYVDWDNHGEDDCREPIEATEHGLFFANMKYQDNDKVKLYDRSELVLYNDIENYVQL
jgi:hypothetical protein